MGSPFWPLVLLGCSAGLSSILGTGSRCEKACNPQMGNLGHGRKLWTDTTCGYNSTELYCSYSENTDLLCMRPKCSKCNSMNTHLAHLASAMVDSSFRLPHTWWQSAQGVEREKIQLNLETEFYFTHLIMIFKSPRPAAMVLERSQDFGKTWKPYKYFSINCSAAFGLDDDVTKKEALCTSRYSSHFPCTGGENPCDYFFHYRRSCGRILRWSQERNQPESLYSHKWTKSNPSLNSVNPYPAPK